MIDKGALTAHFIAHWGVPLAIRPHKVPGLGAFAILEFAPRGDRKTWRYCTNGMSSSPQTHADARIEVRTEIYACTAAQATWVDEILIAVAAYPHGCSTYIAEGDTIDTGQPIGSFFTGILFAPPGPVDPATIGEIPGQERILVHQVVGLLPAEIDYAKKHGGEVVWRRLAEKGEPLFDVPRPSAL